MRYLGSVTDDKDLVNKAKVTSMIQDNIDTTLTKSTYSADAKATGDALKNLDETKQDNLTFDNTPTQNSQNPVKSGGVYTALSRKQNTLTFDGVPMSNSANPVRSSGIKTAIDDLGAIMAQGDQQLNQKIDDQVQQLNEVIFEQYAELDERITDADNRITNIEDGLDEYAKVDGSYDAMTVGAAEQLLSNSYIENTTPYVFRKTADGASVGNRAYIDEFVGGTIVWNQLVRGGDAPTTVDGITFTPNYNGVKGTWHIEGTRTSEVAYSKLEIMPNFWRDVIIKNHVYYVYFDAPTAAIMLTDGHGKGGFCCVFPEVYTEYNNSTDSLYIEVADTGYVNATVRPMIIDLTLMFGSKIADYIYSLGNTAALAWFRKLFPNNYYAYDAGTLKSYRPTSSDLAYKTTGINQWDEQWELGTIDPTTGQNASTTSTVIRAKNINPCLPNETYYLGENVSTVFWYDSDGGFISSQYNGSDGYVRTSPANAAGFRFTTKSGYGATYKNDLCINLSSDRNGEYEPYQEFSYNFPAATMRLRGIPKLDANNRLYYDGDTYSQSGTITRRFEHASLSAQNWTMLSAGIFWAPISGRAFAAGKFNLRCDKYATQEASNSTISNIQSLFNIYGNGLYVNGGSDTIYICDASCSTLNEFRSKITGSGVFIYEKATASTTSATKFPSTIVVDRYGTERFVDSRTVRVPVGHITRYTQDLAGKLEAQPDVAPDDGDYIIRQTNGKMALVAKTNVYPTPPTASGRYQIIATISGGSVTYSWEAV